MTSNYIQPKTDYAKLCISIQLYISWVVNIFEITLELIIVETFILNCLQWSKIWIPPSYQLGINHVCVILSRRRDTITQTWYYVSRRRDTSFLTFIKNIVYQLFKWANTWLYLNVTQRSHFRLKNPFLGYQKIWLPKIPLS